ncbi:MAG: hypothetical protein J1E34_01580 [Oscillospiraceae bacterium]|nr:hypothetical protein [Oscillospiraceae bacterium]
MKNKITALILITAFALSLFCGCKKTGSEKNAINAHNLTGLCDENGEVFMFMMLSDGWMMAQFAQRATVTDESMGGVSYKVLSDDVFLWQPSQESIEALGAQDAVLEARILYSDPGGRYIIYGPNTDEPSDANILINPDYFSEVADEGSVIVDDGYQIFYKMKDKPMKELSNSLKLHSFDEAVYYESAD